MSCVGFIKTNANDKKIKVFIVLPLASKFIEYIHCRERRGPCLRSGLCWQTLCTPSSPCATLSSRSAERTFYSNHMLYGKFLHYKSIYERKGNFREGRLYDVYKQAKQKRIFSALLEEGDTITDYYDPGNGLYLARGHLAPKVKCYDLNLYL